MQPAKVVSLLAKYREDRVFSSTTLFHTFAERLVRQHVMAYHGMSEGHPSFDEELSLIAESESEIREYLSKATIRWPVPWATAKAVVVQYVRKCCADRLRELDLEPDVSKAVLRAVSKDDLSRMFPPGWTDS